MSESNLQALVIQKVDNPIRERSMQFLTQLCVKKKKKKTLIKQHTDTPLPVAIGPFMSLLLSSQPVLCMVSETKEAVDHTTWEHFLFSFNNSGSWVFNNTVQK